MESSHMWLDLLSAAFCSDVICRYTSKGHGQEVTEKA